MLFFPLRRSVLDASLLMLTVVWALLNCNPANYLVRLFKIKGARLTLPRSPNPHQCGDMQDHKSDIYAVEI